MKQAILLVIVFAVVLAGTSLKSSVAGENQTQSAMNYQKANLKKGAQLYDNWPRLTHTDSEGTHPLYPGAAKKSKATWRCKECHGWDYIGNKGRYREGSHFTGISGVFHVKEEKPEVLYDSLTNKKSQHDFSQDLPQAAIWDLIKFLREGQLAIEFVINNPGQGQGDSSLGKVLYKAYCADCHGDDGDKIDFKGKKEGIQGVGWLANTNPQESIHKIRWGHPGSDMPSMIVDKKLSDKDTIDILTYSQSLDN